MKTILLTAAVLLALLQSALAYSLGGPIGNGGDAWQIQALSYDEPGDLNAPKNLGEEYRRNTPVMFYTYDQIFGDYFGSSGMDAIDSAFTTLNLMFTNSPQGPIRGLDGYSTNLVEFPLESRHRNYQAEALGVIDMKTVTLGLMTEQLGLTDPVRYAWTLHDRYLPPGGVCPPDEEYLVVQRNFDYVSSSFNQLQYSPYVNDTLYCYQIVEFCTGTPWLAQAVPFSVDPIADTYSPVADYFAGNIYWGDYYSGYTRDDVAGLRYLMQTNNVNYETVSPDSLLYTITTNTAAPEVFPPYIASGTNFVSGTNTGYYIFSGATNSGYGYGDLGAFIAFSKTNDPATLQATYPGVVISSVSNSVTIVSNQTIIAYYTNAPIGSPYGSPPVLVVTTNYTPVFQILYYYTFANVFTNHYTTGTESLVTVSVASAVGSPYGSPGITNMTVKKIKTISGDFFVLPQFYTNVCPIDILPYGSITTVLATTNLLTTAITNTITVNTNTSATNITSYVYLVTYFTNYSYVIDPVTCTTTAGASGKYQGIDKIQFVKVPYGDYDTTFGILNPPVTNNYTLNLLTNNQLVVQHFQRIVTVPDFLFSGEDLVSGPADVLANPIDTRNLNFNTANVLPLLAGPGTIETPTEVRWNKAGPVFYNTPAFGMDGTPYFTAIPSLTNAFYTLYHALGSFDGSTNPPTVFSDGASIDNLENQVLIQITPQTVDNGSVGEAYPSVQFSASGGQLSSSFTWSASGLPDGLSMNPGGLLSGTPSESGTFDFVVKILDSTGLTVQWYYTITIQ